MYWLATVKDRIQSGTMKRFHPLFWTVNFPRPMMAAVTNSAGDALDVRLCFYRKGDLAGLIWESEDLYDHPLTGYITNKDYRGLQLSFRWQGTNIRGLDAVEGPTLTIEGRDEAGQPAVWYVRLWNYAVGSPNDAVISLDFDRLMAGFMLPDEAVPVFAGDIDRMFISLMPMAYEALSDTALETSAVEARVSLTGIRARGAGAMLGFSDVYVPKHETALANGFDDSCNLVPERIFRNARMLGYGGLMDHYVGMSHYFALVWSADEAGFIVDPAQPLNRAAEHWHRAFFAAAKEYGVDVLLSLSFELFDAHTPQDWKQRTHDGQPAQTGWAPPSTLLAPTHAGAMAYLEAVFLAFLDLNDDAGGRILAQIGEPWWWYQIAGDKAPCFYDAGTVALYETETGLDAPSPHADIFELPDAAQGAYLDWLGGKLGAATGALRDAVRAAYPDVEVSLLFFTPQVLHAEAPMVRRVNFPVTAWAKPAFDCLDVEDYDYLVDGDWAAHENGIAAVEQELGYGPEDSRYFSGFVLNPGHPEIWAQIDRAAVQAKERQYRDVVIWAYSQVMRDGYVHFDGEEDQVSGFHEVRFPDRIAKGSSGGPRFATTVVETVSGHEMRNAEWAEARAEYDVGTGVQSDADLAALMTFFRARRGRAFGFRFRDWSDDRSCAPGQEPQALDQVIAVGDGAGTTFQLVKRYESGGEMQIRRIQKPVPDSIQIALDAVVVTSGWSVDVTRGTVSFTEAPALGVVVTAGYLFDVPVRFRDDRLSVTVESFAAGQAPDVGLVEIRI